MNAAIGLKRPQVQSMVFIHSTVDELGLSASEFRVYCHLARRADNATRIAYAGHDSMASVCRLDIKTVRRALQVLVERGLITVERHPGYPNYYGLTPQSCWQLETDTDAGDEPACPGTATMHPRCRTGKDVRCQTGKGVTLSAPHEGNPWVLPEGNPKKHTTGDPDDAQESDRVCAPAASFLMPVARTETSEGDQRAKPPAQVKTSVCTPYQIDCVAPKDQKTFTRVRERFEKIWHRLRPEYRGDEQPAFAAFSALNPDAVDIERLLLHRETWEKRAAESESGVTGWVPKPKHFAGYLRVRQFETPLPVPVPLRSMPGSAAVSSPATAPSPEAERIAELKRLGVVAVALLPERKAELEDRYAFATGLTGFLRFEEILVREPELRQLAADVARQPCGGRSGK